MFNLLRTHILRVLRVPGEPQAPAGAPGSVRIFRAGSSFYKLHLLIWAGSQALTLIGIVFSVGLLLRLEYDIEQERAASPAAASSPSDQGKTPAPESAEPPKKQQVPITEQDIARLAARAPWWVLPLLTGIKIVGIIAYLVQFPLTYSAVRLNYEQRWYIVTDRSLRIRSGLVSLQEATMSFANVQHVTVTQGPLQRLLGISDVRVQSAGGGGDDPQKGEHDSMHVGIFHGVDNAGEIRDLVLERLRLFREAGLGDPDDSSESGILSTQRGAATTEDNPLAAVRELLQAARDLRAAREAIQS